MSVLVRMNNDGLTVLDGLDALTFNRRGEFTGVQEKYTLSRIRGFLALPVLSVLQVGNSSMDVMLFENAKQTRIQTTAVPADFIMAVQGKGSFIRMVYRRGIYKADSEDVRYIQTLFIYRAGTDLRPMLRSLGCSEASS